MERGMSFRGSPEHDGKMTTISSSSQEFETEHSCHQRWKMHRRRLEWAELGWFRGTRDPETNRFRNLKMDGWKSFLFGMGKNVVLCLFQGVKFGCGTEQDESTKIQQNLWAKILGDPKQCSVFGGEMARQWSFIARCWRKDHHVDVLHRADSWHWNWSGWYGQYGDTSTDNLCQIQP